MWTCVGSYATSEGGLAENELASSELSSPEAAAPGGLSVPTCRSRDGHPPASRSRGEDPVVISGALRRRGPASRWGRVGANDGCS